MDEEIRNELISQTQRMAMLLGECIFLIEYMHNILNMSNYKNEDIDKLKERIFKKINVIFYG